jgi:hypothetical protein
MPESRSSHDPSASESPARRPANPWVHACWAFAFVAVMAIGFLYFRQTLETMQSGYETTIRELKATLVHLEKIAKNFMTGNITERFVADVPRFQDAGIGRLELGTAEATETFSQSDSRSVLWDWVPLGETVSEIKVPVTYRYHLDLGGTWRIEVRDGVCLVVAPKIQPSLPPAIHTDRMEKRTTAGWARFNKQENLDALERTITPTISRYAADAKHLDAVREKCRITAAKFIQLWLLQREQWGAEGIRAVKVVFEDEARDLETQAPTITIEN